MQKTRGETYCGKRNYKMERLELHRGANIQQPHISSSALRAIFFYHFSMVKSGKRSRSKSVTRTAVGSGGPHDIPSYCSLSPAYPAYPAYNWFVFRPQHC